MLTHEQHHNPGDCSQMGRSAAVEVREGGRLTCVGMWPSSSAPACLLPSVTALLCSLSDWCRRCDSAFAATPISFLMSMASVRRTSTWPCSQRGVSEKELMPTAEALIQGAVLEQLRSHAGCSKGRSFK